MNVADDPLAKEWSHPRSLDTATAELEVLDQINESERSDRDKCALILHLLHRSRPLGEIRSAVDVKVSLAKLDAAAGVASTKEYGFEATKQNLLVKVMHDEAKLGSLIDFERDELKRNGRPQEPVEALMKRAIGRWERDNAGTAPLY